MFLKPHGHLLSALAAVLLLTGCIHFGQEPTAIVPVQQTAAAQYAYAKNYQANRQIDLIIDDNRYERARDVVIQTYEKVAEYFPEDRQYTPLARLDVIIMEAGFDSPRAELQGRAMRRHMEQTIADLEQLAADYPENEKVQAMSLYLRGMAAKRMQDFVEAQTYFKAVRDNFSESDNQEIRRLAENAALFYNQVYTQE